MRVHQQQICLTSCSSRPGASCAASEGSAAHLLLDSFECHNIHHRIQTLSQSYLSHSSTCQKRLCMCVCWSALVSRHHASLAPLRAMWRLVSDMHVYCPLFLNLATHFCMCSSLPFVPQHNCCSVLLVFHLATPHQTCCSVPLVFHLATPLQTRCSVPLVFHLAASLFFMPRGWLDVTRH